MFFAKNWIPAFAGMTIAGADILLLSRTRNGITLLCDGISNPTPFVAMLSISKVRVSSR